MSFRLPWDQNHVVGWVNQRYSSINKNNCLFRLVFEKSLSKAFETVYCISWLALLLFVNPLFLTLFYSICEYHAAFLEIFRSQCREINAIIIECEKHSNYELKLRVHGLIVFHVAVGK